jgi:hypothetical protein
MQGQEIKAFLDNPTENPISSEELADYYQHRGSIDEATDQFFFPDS